MKRTVLGTLVIFAMACNPFKAVEYRGLTDIDFAPRSFAESRLSAKIQVFNPNSYKITVKRIEADIEVNGSNWGQYRLDSSFILPAKEEFSFPIALVVKNGKLIDGALKLASGSQLPYQLKGRIKGTYRSLSADVPFVHSGQFTDQDIRF